MTEIKRLYPNASINIANYKFMKSNYKRKNVDEIILMFQNIRNIVNNPEKVNKSDLPKNVLDSSETVHITSINKCILDAIDIIKEKSESLPPLKGDPIRLLLYEINENPIVNKNWLEAIKKYFNPNPKNKKHPLENSINSWCLETQKHSIHILTFYDLFVMIMKIIMNHENKEDLKERLITELTDSKGMCFTGRINRMVNSLVGFIDNIHVSISNKEEIQMRIGAIIKRLIEEKIDKEQAKKEMQALFDNVREDDNITENYKISNLQALEEFDDAPTALVFAEEYDLSYDTD